MFDFELRDQSEKSLVIFSGQLEGNDSEYGDEIDRILKKRRHPYKEIIFLFPSYIETEIASFIENGDRLLSNINRATSAEQISFVSFDGFANLSTSKKVITGNPSISDAPDKLKTEIIKSGIHSLVEKRKDQVILKSPPGTIFKKPSQKKFNEFIKASELSVGFSENQFVAFTLLSSRPEREDKHQIKNIWIDTSSISLFIEPLIYYIKNFNEDSYKRVKYHSFQSYGDEETVGYKTCIPDTKDDIWVIISASRSNSMGRDIHKVWKGLDHDQIVTILSYSDTELDQNCLSYSPEDNKERPKEPGDKIVVNISEFSEHHNKEKQFGSEVPVKIIGENFTAQVEEPNQVLLRKVHGTKEISDFIEPLNETTCFYTHKKKESRKRSIFFDFTNFSTKETKLRKKYYKWLKDAYNWYIPSDCSQVIYDFKDSASVQLFQDLEKASGNSSFIKLDINNIKSIEADKPIIALMPVITRGHSFVKLNSDLRLLKHDAQRIFIAPFALPYTKGDFDLFTRSLVFGPRNLKYHFINFRKAYIGHQEERNSWDRELDLLGRFSTPLWREREMKLQEQSTGLNDAIGISCDINDAKLKFNIDFAFWSPGYTPETVSAPAVYLTVSSILQNLREKPYTDFDKESLFTHVYQHSVLDPLNFSRFNDPLLQSCLWRCAYDGELDYRTPNELSRKFVDILIRLAQSKADGDLNATLDLLVGIAIGKIKLSEEHLKEAITSLKDSLGGFPEYAEILDYIDNDFSVTEPNNHDLIDVI